ncbi:LexA family protein [Streptomyces tauricus]|uniref:LexA family protein n=1 Tax=Streptomyces tauricus TaxID=68274 RepID=UPI0016766E4B|nr:hypothetical protein [Streptomyces tauricus]
MNRRPAHLSERKEQILACIRRSIVDRGEGPTMAEIGVAVGLRSKGTVAYHLHHLEERGVLVRDGYGWRSCRLARCPLQASARWRDQGCAVQIQPAPLVCATLRPAWSGRWYEVMVGLAAAVSPRGLKQSPGARVRISRGMGNTLRRLQRRSLRPGHGLPALAWLPAGSVVAAGRFFPVPAVGGHALPRPLNHRPRALVA